MPELLELLQMVVDRNGSDLHLRAGEPPIIRIHGDLIRTQYPVLNSDEIERLVYSIMNAERRAAFEKRLEMDMSYATDFARFRVNVFRQQGHVGSVMRLIPIAIKTIDELMLPPVTKDLALRPRGLLLVTGPTGSGKSTTLAAIIDHINMNRRGHIMTIEDPIEFTHPDKLCSINQRELGEDTHSFSAALKHVMRQNPDVILVGEMRDLETIQLAITAAETGHLVFSTVHTSSASETLDRIINLFPPHERATLCLRMSNSLRGVISQKLLPRIDAEGRVAGLEIMIVTPTIAKLVEEGKAGNIYSAIQEGNFWGMQTMNQCLIKYFRAGIISEDDALRAAGNITELKQMLRRPT